MIRIFLTSIFTAIALISFSQLASWDLTTAPGATQVAANVNAMPFTKGSGTGTLTIGSTGAYCSGWTTNTSPDFSDYFQVAIAPQAGYRLNITSVAFSERRSLTGPGEYQLQYDVDSNFTNPVTLTTFVIPDDDLARDGTISGLNIIVNDGDTMYFRWYGYKAESAAGTWRINSSSLHFDGTVTQANPNDVNSYAVDPVTQVPTLTLIPAGGGFSEVFRFKIVDAGTNDGLSTDVTFINITNAISTGGADWTISIDSAIIKQGTNVIPVASTLITGSNIFFTIPSGSIIIADDNNTEISLYVMINDSGITDGSSLQFKIPASGHGWDAAVTGSGFGPTFPADIISSVHTIDIQATHYTFTILPQSIWQNLPFSVSAIATDANGNIDAGYNGIAELMLEFGSGSLSAAGGLSRNFANGIFYAGDIVYNGTDWLRMKLRDDAGVFPIISTPLIFSAPDNITLDDDFNDGNYPDDPVWVGTTADFIVTPDTMLHLYTVTTGDDTSFVVSPVSYQADSIEWSAVIKLAFSPSSSNYARFYLVSDQPDLLQPVNGYYLQIGETGSTDAIEMFRLDNGTATSVMRGPDGQVAANPFVRIKVVRYISGNWKLYADLTGNFGYQLLATGFDSTYMIPRFFSGFYTKYTQTYASGKFYFDDAYCGPVRVDTVPPALVSVSLKDSAALELVFSEAILDIDATVLSNYSVSGSVGNPFTASQNPSDKTRITLRFSPAFVSGNSYTLSVSGLHDLAGNLLPVSQKDFSYYLVQKFDVEVNEILADPSPVVQLPEWEYIELYNRSAYEIDLNQWTISVGSTVKTLPSVTIAAEGYLILTHVNGSSEFSSFGNVLGLFTSSTMLTNSGADIELRDKDGRLIHSVSYSDSWYETTYKRDGGWSLEQIDPANPCAEGSNWKESSGQLGGTPGALNSVYSPNPDTQGPSLLKAILVQPDTVMLYFSEIIDTAQALNLSSYIVDYNIGNPVSAEFSGSTGKIISLVFGHEFGHDTLFTVTVTGQIRDCIGNIISSGQSAKFAYTYIPNANEIVVNEILFDPREGGQDYIEIYNRSQKVFNLNDVRLADFDGSLIDAILPVTEEGQYIFPGDHMVITTDPAAVSSQYTVINPGNMVTAPSLPTMNNDAGRIMLLSVQMDTLDDFSYTDQMQFQLLSSFEGVALERMNYDLPTQDAANWHSAAQNAGFGTPTYKNSQYAEPGSADGELSLEPEIFSPDLDGYNDVLYIHYNFGEPGFIANFVIFNSAGRIVRTIAANELLSASGTLVWDGLDYNNAKAILGIYVVYAEVFDLNGTVKHYKKTCVVAGKNE